MLKGKLLISLKNIKKEPTTKVNTVMEKFPSTFLLMNSNGVTLYFAICFCTVLTHMIWGDEHKVKR